MRDSPKADDIDASPYRILMILYWKMDGKRYRLLDRAREALQAAYENFSAVEDLDKGATGFLAWKMGNQHRLDSR